MSYKYVIVKAGNREIPVIFPSEMVHSAMAEIVKDHLIACIKLAYPGMPASSMAKARKAITAVAGGTITFDVVGCGGFSETLKVQSRGAQDAQLITSFPYTSGYVED